VRSVDLTIEPVSPARAITASSIVDQAAKHWGHFVRRREHEVASRRWRTGHEQAAIRDVGTAYRLFLGGDRMT
jgi:hypothetical protein